jgi:formamidopyrimidine-DNA glycosylase
VIELPEAISYANQVNLLVRGKKIKSIITEYTPHKFAWYNGDPKKYKDLLVGKVINEAKGIGSMVEIKADDTVMLFCDGANIRHHETEKSYPKKHQLLIGFEDATAISVSIQMYGGIWCFRNGEFNNGYYEMAKQKPSPLSDIFSEKYFFSLLNPEDTPKLSVKAFIATEQRIPGLGNGVLQDILWKAKLHPKRKMNTLQAEDMNRLFNSIKNTLSQITEHGGRDTEKGLLGEKGGYKTTMSKNNVGKTCPDCGGVIIKENYMGGSIYFCDDCQKQA